MALVVKNPPANAGDVRDVGLIPELGGSPEESHGWGVWQAIVHWVTKNRTQLKELSTAHKLWEHENREEMRQSDKHIWYLTDFDVSQGIKNCT